MDIALARRRELRRAATDAEQVLWRLLRRRQFAGVKFRRQHPIGRYILDFYCADHGLAVELEGTPPQASPRRREAATREGASAASEGGCLTPRAKTLASVFAHGINNS